MKFVGQITRNALDVKFVKRVMKHLLAVLFLLGSSVGMPKQLNHPCAADRPARL
jgi:hypothetical protein